MPTPLKKHRTYCKTCENFTIHSWADKENLICNICDTKETGYNIKDVNPDLILLQRERYNRQKMNQLKRVYGTFTKGLGIQALMDLDKISQDVIEDDAGQIQIDNFRRQRKLKEQQEKQELYIDYVTNYKHLNRNDKCSCGSGKKYKHCHLNNFRNIK